MILTGIQAFMSGLLPEIVLNRFMLNVSCNYIVTVKLSDGFDGSS